MDLRRVHHVAIIGSDYERSRHFYVDLLGFEVIRENHREAQQDWKIDLRLHDDTEIKGDKVKCGAS